MPCGLDVAHGHEADAHRRGRIGADDYLPLVLREDPPTQHLRPEPGESREVMGVEDDVIIARADKDLPELVRP